MKLKRKKILKESYDRWDLHVKNNNNFVVNGCVVHNSNLSLVKKEGVLFVNSRNLSIEESDSNSYWKGARKFDWVNLPDNLWLYGELLPVQDLKYGLNTETILFFDARTDDRWLSYDEFVKLLKEFNLPMVPEIYRGPFSKEIVKLYTSGKEQVSGKEWHIREGCVVRTTNRRMMLKSVSEDYLLRKGGTELH